MSQPLHGKYSRIFSKTRFLSPLHSPTHNCTWSQYTYRIQIIHTNLLILLFHIVEKTYS